MAHIVVKKLLRRIGLLDVARAAKSRVSPVHHSFTPCTPHLLVAVQRSLRWWQEAGRGSDGDYLEFGIFRGFTFWYTQALAADMGIEGMRFFGFDSFAGLPAVRGVDLGGEFREGDYESPKEEVVRFLNEHGVDWERTVLVDGWYDKTLSESTRSRYAMRRCAVAVVDCDLYESARLALGFVGPLIRGEAVILFDDWECFSGDPSRGEKRAFSEFLEQRPELRSEPFCQFGPYGRGFLVRSDRVG